MFIQIKFFSLRFLRQPDRLKLKGRVLYVMQEAKIERELWFKEKEIHSYKRVEELLMLGE
jgi:hypothetical protein